MTSSSIATSLVAIWTCGVKWRYYPTWRSVRKQWKPWALNWKEVCCISRESWGNKLAEISKQWHLWSCGSLSRCEIAGRLVWVACRTQRDRCCEGFIPNKKPSVFGYTTWKGSMAIATPISLGLSKPRKLNRHLWEWRPSTFTRCMPYAHLE